jgi:hypothetical protein
MPPKLIKRCVYALALSVLVAPGRARADDTGSTPKVDLKAQAETKADRPWADEVPESSQKEALTLFEEGNKLFETSEHAAALAKYRKALESWDHPAIRYNAAVALINLDQPLAANENLELALRFGALPFSADTYQQALTYRKLLRGQLAQLKVSCAEPGAEVTLDGAPLFVGPSDASRWVLPGPHQIVARKPGFLTETRSLTLLPGKPASQTVVLQEQRTVPVKTVSRWAVWKPWTVLGAGVLVGLVGLPVWLDAKSNMNAFDAQVGQSCPMGCQSSALPQSAWDAKDRGHAENIIAVSLFSVGGVVAASGLAMLLLNQPHIVPAETSEHVAAMPLIGPGTIGLSIAFQR